MSHHPGADSRISAHSFPMTLCFIPHLCLPCLRSPLLFPMDGSGSTTSKRGPTFTVWSASRSTEVEINGCVSICGDGPLLSTKGRVFLWKVLKWVGEMWVSTFGGELKERTRWGGRQSRTDMGGREGGVGGMRRKQRKQEMQELLH